MNAILVLIAAIYLTLSLSTRYNISVYTIILMLI